MALLASHLGVDEPVMQGSTLAVGVTRNQTHADRMLLPPVARPERVQWGDVLEDGVLSGKAPAWQTTKSNETKCGSESMIAMMWSAESPVSR